MAEVGYRQFCPVAKGAEIVATRWTPLVLRELMSGERSFNDIHRGVPLMSRALLAQRLRQLENDGIIRRVVIGLAQKENLPVIETNLTRFDPHVADEFFLTGTAAEVIGVVEIDGRKIGDGRPGPVTKLLRKKFFEYARS